MANIPVGTTTLIFNDLSANINPQSVQIHADGNFTILSVKTDIEYANRQLKAKEIETCGHNKKLYKPSWCCKIRCWSIDQQEEQTLLKNQFTIPQNTTLDIEKLKLSLDFQTLRLTEIKSGR